MFSPCMFKPLSVQGPSVYFFSFLTCSLHVCTTSIYVQGPSACTASHVFPRVFKPLSVQGPSVYFFPFLHGPSTCVQLIYVCRDPLRALCQCALCLTVSACTVFPCRTLCVHSVFFSFLTWSLHVCTTNLCMQGPSACTLSVRTVSHCVSLCLRALSFRAGPCACTPSFFPFLHVPTTHV